MSAASWGALLVAWVAAVAMPGPDIFLLFKLALRSRAQAVAAALGIMLGNLVWATASVAGMNALIAAFPPLLPAIQVAGSLVLVWLGAQSLRGGLAQLKATAATREVTVTHRPFMLGLVTNLSNPKALIFFTALLSQFIPHDASWFTNLSIIAVMWVTGVAWFVGVAMAASARAFRAWFGRAIPWIDIVAGLVFIAVALTILAEVVFAFTSPR